MSPLKPHFAFALCLVGWALFAHCAVCSFDASFVPADGAVVPLLTDVQKAHLDRPVDDRTNRFNNVDYRKSLRPEKGWYPRPVDFSWKGHATNEYAVVVRRERDGQVFYRGVVKGTALRLDNFEAACAYEWSVMGPDANVKARFVTEDRAPRFLRVEGIPNVRDLGGRIGLGGRRVRQNCVFRTAGLNENASAPKSKEFETNLAGTTNRPQKVKGATRITDANRDYLLKTLAIKSDIDLRSDGECWGMTGSPLGSSVTWYHIPSSAYAGLDKEGGRQSFAKVFRVFLDEKNYPIAFHCIAGQDRTGAVAFILLALLGVDEQAIWCDWESSAFWNASPKWLNYRNFNGLRSVFAPCEGKSICEKVEKYVLSLGFTMSDIEKFRSLMLEP